MPNLDHIMYASADLTLGVEEIADLTGVKPADGGSHPGMGTCNALLSLGEDQYLEIIAPDHSQRLSGTTGELLINHGGSGIRGWAVATTDLDALTVVASNVGYGCKDTIDMSRTTPQGVHLAWQLRFFTGNSLLPFFIDWKASPHPALSTPKGCSLMAFGVTTQEPQAYQQLVQDLSLDVSVTHGEDQLTSVLNTPKGLVRLEGW